MEMCIFALQFFWIKHRAMSRICELTGKKMMTGNNVSHSKRRTKRQFQPNIIVKRFFIPEEDKWVTLKLSAKAMKTINKIGVSAALKRSREAGFYKG